MLAFIKHLRFLLICLLLFTNTVFATEFGNIGFSGNPGTNGGSNCAVCHAPGVPKPTVTLSGPNLVQAGQTYNYTVIVQGGKGATAGVNISTSGAGGLLAPIVADLSLIGRELAHVKPKTMVSNRAVFRFRWTAPPYNKTVTLFAAGNSSDGKHTLLGDSTGNASLFVKVINGAVPPAPPGPKPSTPIVLEHYVEDTDGPILDITHAKDSRLFIAEALGRIRIAKGKDSLLPTPFLDITDRVFSASPSLLGFAFHPNYASNGYFYVHYLYLRPGTNLLLSRLSRFQRSVDPDIANPSSEFVLMEFAVSFNTGHFGGDVHFGPDGYLYIISGDSNDEIRPQQFHSLLGKLMRIDVNGAPGSANGPDCDISGRRNYRIPPGNAFTDGKKGQGCDEIYALGFRNPWNFSFDRETGDLWVGDVGADVAEEIDFIPSGASGGLNLGWRCYEGEGVYNLLGCNRSYLYPVHTPLHESGNVSVMGGYVYRGRKYPKLRGKYFFTDFYNSSIRTITGSRSKPIVSEVLPRDVVLSPVTFGEDYNGELYVVSYGGAVYRIIDPTVP